MKIYGLRLLGRHLCSHFWPYVFYDGLFMTKIKLIKQYGCAVALDLVLYTFKKGILGLFKNIYMYIYKSRRQ